MFYLKIISAFIVGTIITLIYQYFITEINISIIFVTWVFGLVALLIHYTFIGRKKNSSG